MFGLRIAGFRTARIEFESGETPARTLVLLHDETGATGTGEARGGPELYRQVREIAAALNGATALHVQALATDGYDLDAIGAVENALWDLAGRRLGSSLSVLMGGCIRSRVDAVSEKELRAAIDPDGDEDDAEAVALRGSIRGAEDVARAALGDRAGVILGNGTGWGGIAPFMDAAAAAAVFGTDLAIVDDPGLGISLAVNLHLAAALDAVTRGVLVDRNHLARCTLARPGFTVERGSIAVPAGPGTGVELDHDALAAYTVEVAVVEGRGASAE